MLTHDEIIELHEVAVRAGLADHRGGLLSGLPRELVASLDKVPTPTDQMLSDLQALSNAGPLEDGHSPLRRWLQAAVTLTRQRGECKRFEEALQKLDREETKSTAASVRTISVRSAARAAGAPRTIALFLAAIAGAVAMAAWVKTTRDVSPSYPAPPQSAPPQEDAGPAVPTTFRGKIFHRGTYVRGALVQLDGPDECRSITNDAGSFEIVLTGKCALPPAATLPAPKVRVRLPGVDVFCKGTAAVSAGALETIEVHDHRGAHAGCRIGDDRADDPIPSASSSAPPRASAPPAATPSCVLKADHYKKATCTKACTRSGDPQDPKRYCPKE